MECSQTNTSCPGQNQSPHPPDQCPLLPEDDRSHSLCVWANQKPPISLSDLIEEPLDRTSCSLLPSKNQHTAESSRVFERTSWLSVLEYKAKNQAKTLDNSLNLHLYRVVLQKYPPEILVSDFQAVDCEVLAVQVFSMNHS